MLLVEKKDGVARVTLNRPDVRNAFDDSLISELRKAFLDVGGDPSVRAMVLAGNGPAFCAGADLNWMKRMAGYDYAANLRDAQGLADMLATLDRMPKPTIARVHGPAFAGGTGLVAACDIAVGTRGEVLLLRGEARAFARDYRPAPHPSDRRTRGAALLPHCRGIRR